MTGKSKATDGTPASESDQAGSYQSVEEYNRIAGARAALPPPTGEAMAVCDAFDVLYLSEAYGGSGATSVSSKDLTALEKAVRALRASIAAASPSGDTYAKGYSQALADVEGGDHRRLVRTAASRDEAREWMLSIRAKFEAAIIRESVSSTDIREPVCAGYVSSTANYGATCTACGQTFLLSGPPHICQRGKQ